MKKFKFVVSLDILDYDANSAVDTLFQIAEMSEDQCVSNWQIIDVHEVTEEEV